MNNIEKSLKRWLKRKMTISLATIVAFAITGNIAYAYEIVAGTENNISSNEVYENTEQLVITNNLNNTTINIDEEASLSVENILLNINDNSSLIVKGGEFTLNIDDGIQERGYNYHGVLTNYSGNMDIDVNKFNITGNLTYPFDVFDDYECYVFKGVETNSGTTTSIIADEINITLNANEGVLEGGLAFGINNSGSTIIATNNGDFNINFNVSDGRGGHLIENLGDMNIDLGTGDMNFNLSKIEQKYTDNYFIYNSGDNLEITADRMYFRFENTYKRYITSNLNNNGASSAQYISGIYNTPMSGDFEANVNDIYMNFIMNTSNETKSDIVGLYFENESNIVNAKNNISIYTNTKLNDKDELVASHVENMGIITKNGNSTITTNTLDINLSLSNKTEQLEGIDEFNLTMLDNRQGGTVTYNTDSIRLTGNVEDVTVNSVNFTSFAKLIGINNEGNEGKNSNLDINTSSLEISLTNNAYEDKNRGKEFVIGINNLEYGIADIDVTDNIVIKANVSNFRDNGLGYDVSEYGDGSTFDTIGIVNKGELNVSANNLAITSINKSKKVSAIVEGIENTSELDLDIENTIQIDVGLTSLELETKPYTKAIGINNTGTLNSNSNNLIITGDFKNGFSNSIGIENTGVINIINSTANATEETNELLQITGFNTSIKNTETMNLENSIFNTIANNEVLVNAGTFTLNSDTINMISNGEIAIKNESGTTEINGETSIITGDIEVTSGNVDVTSNSMLLTGDILGEGTASVSMKDDSTFTGKVLGVGKNLDMTSSLWTMTGDSTVNNLNLDNTKIDMSGEAKRIDVNKISGNNGTILMDISKTDSDFFSIKGADTENTHNIEITKNSILNVINNDFSTGGFLLGEADKKVTFEGQTIDSLENIYKYDIYLEGVDKGELNDWYISGYKEGEETEVVESVEDDLSIYMMNSILARQDIDSLHKRLGDIRAYKEESGVWARYQTGELEFNQSDIYAKNKYSNIEVGYDKSKDNKITGFSVNNRTGNADFRNGSGENRSTGITLYRSYEGTEGKYYDIVGKGFFLTNDNVTTNNKDEVMKADYDTYGGSLGLELGKSYFEDKWYLKPHLQGTYTYIKGADYETTTGVEVEQDDYNSLIGKAGLYAGYDFENSNHFIKLDLLHEFLGEGKVKMTGADRSLSKSIDTKETWIELGIGGDFKVSDNMNVYYELDKTLSSDSFKHWQGTIGFRYRFNKLEELNPVVVLRDFTLKGDSYFDFDKSTLKAEGKAVIKVMSNEINNEERTGKLQIEGHTDSIGTESYNQKLSERRAKAVEEEFKKNLTKEVEYEVKGYGETKPIDTNTTSEGRAKNRRVEIKYIVEGQDER